MKTLLNTTIHSKPRTPIHKTCNQSPFVEKNIHFNTVFSCQVSFNMLTCFDSITVAGEQKFELFKHKAVMQK